MKRLLNVVTVACSILFCSCAFLDNLVNNLSCVANANVSGADARTTASVQPSIFLTDNPNNSSSL